MEMKDVYFQMLDFKGKIHDIDEFHVLGFVPNLLDKTKELHERVMLLNGENDLRQRGIDTDALKTDLGGCHLSFSDYPVEGARTSWIYYNEFQNESDNIFVRAHEEAHAVCFFGLRSELEKKIGSPYLSDLYEEDFCDQVGLQVLRRKGIEPPSNFLRPMLTEWLLL